MSKRLKPLKNCFEEVFGSLRRLASCAGSAPALFRRVVIGCRCGEIQRRSPNTILTHFFRGFRLFLISLTLFLFSLPQKTLLAEPGKTPAKTNDVYVVFLIIDGVNRDFFYGLLENGELPVIKKNFIDEGAIFKDAVTVFPSASTGAYQSFISGLFGGHAGIPYLGWFDRTTGEPIEYLSMNGYKHINADFLNWRALTDPDEANLYPKTTIFEKLGDHPSAAIYSEFFLGAKTQRPKLPIAGIWSTFVSRRVAELDRYAWENVYSLFNLPLNEIPRFTLAGFYSEDEYGHEEGAKSEYVKLALKQFETFLQGFVDQLKKIGIWEKTYLIAAADHGMHDIKGTFNLTRYLKNKGFNLVNKNPHAGKANVYISARGISAAQVYVKGKNGWEERPTVEGLRNVADKNGTALDIIDTLAHAEPIDILAVRDGHHMVQVYSKDSHGTIVWEEAGGKEWYGYYPDRETDDPLGYSNNKELKGLIASGMHTADEWGPPSVKTDYPDAIVQLSQIFRDGRAGDIFLSSREWSFYRVKKATHGSLISSSMRIPIVMRGPLVPKGSYGFMRSVDMYPTMLDWLGIENSSDHHDGRELFAAPKKSANSNGRGLATKLACRETNFNADWCNGYGQKSIAKVEIRDETERRERLLAKLTKIRSESNLPSSNRWYIDEQIERVKSDIERLAR